MLQPSNKEEPMFITMREVRMREELVDLREEVRKLREEIGFYKTSLRAIKRDGGEVCEHFTVCDHRACKSSLAAWQLADAALAITKDDAYDDRI